MYILRKYELRVNIRIQNTLAVTVLVLLVCLFLLMTAQTSQSARMQRNESWSRDPTSWMQFPAGSPPLLALWQVWQSSHSGFLHFRLVSAGSSDQSQQRESAVTAMD